MSILHLGYEQMCEVLRRQGKRFAPYRSRIPEGESGDWMVSKMTVEIDLQNLRMVRDGRGCSPGEFTRLTRRGETIMSDTDAEILDFLPFVKKAHGEILVAGLGLGCVLQALLNKPEVNRVTVVERSLDVIQLVKPYLEIRDGQTLHIFHDDIFDFTPNRGERFEFSWFDIWDNICGDNQKEITALKSRFRRYCKRQSAWAEAEVRAANRRWS